eukprot:6181789-Pleurochrysis_carterae.AAC.2
MFVQFAKEEVRACLNAESRCLGTSCVDACEYSSNCVVRQAELARCNYSDAADKRWRRVWVLVHVSKARVYA